MLIDEISAFVRTTAPTSEPVTVARAKQQLRLETSFIDDDDYIGDLITVAREVAEDRTGRALLQQDWTITFDNGSLPASGIIELPRPPLQSIQSLTYVDDAGSTTALPVENYTLDTTSQPGRIYFEDMPSIKAVMNALTVNYRAGYADAASVPMVIRQAILLMVTHFYEIREPVVTGTIATKIPFSAEMLLGQKKVRWL